MEMYYARYDTIGCYGNRVINLSEKMKHVFKVMIKWLNNKLMES